MSNRERRPALQGVILQGRRVVGGVELPRRFEAFVEQFNREYRCLGLVVQPILWPRVALVPGPASTTGAA